VRGLLLKILHVMSLVVFTFFANILLFSLLAIYSLTYINNRKNKKINIFSKDIIYLEKIYKLNSYQDSFHN